MNKKNLIAPNSFKEGKNSVEIANILSTFFPQDNTHLLPLSDGGDGFLETCKKNFNLKPISYTIPKVYADDLMKCSIGNDERSKTVYIESALILGLNLIPKNKRYPLVINSKNLGILLNKILEDFIAEKISFNKITIGLGGTGTNDMGLGICSVFGFKMFDSEGQSLEVIPKNYVNARSIEWENQELPFDIEFIVDVNNPLVGPNGATHTYAAQKGADPNQIKILEDGFINILNILKNKGLFKSLNDLSGAGGGIAAGMKIFLDAKTRTSKEFILRDLNMLSFQDKVDYVITGEGAFDRQSLMDKASGIVIETFKDYAEKIFIICGTADKHITENLPKNVEIIELTDFFKNKKESIKNFEKGLWLASEKIRQAINS